MKSKLILIILLISLAFNIGVILRFFPKQTDRDVPIMPEPPAQRTFTGRGVFHNEEFRTIRINNINLRMLYFAELAKPEINKEIISDLAIKLIESQSNLDRAVLNHYLENRLQMTDEEAAEYFTRFKQSYEYRGRRSRENNRNRSNE